MYQLKYYAPAFYRSVHEEIVKVLAEAKDKHGIPYEILELRRKPSDDPTFYLVEEAHEKELYEKDFRPRASLLKGRLGESIRRLLRSRSGGYFLNGRVAIMKDRQVEWVSSHAVPFKEYDGDFSLGFLKALLQNGPILLDQLTPSVEKGQPELQLLDGFIHSGMLSGTFEREVRVGKRILETPDGTFDWRKSIDIVCTTPEATWILEGKLKLNYEALGEVLTYSVLYSSSHLQPNIRRGIVCYNIDEDILEACKEFNVTVFQVVGREVMVHQP